MWLCHVPAERDPDLLHHIVQVAFHVLPEIEFHYNGVVLVSPVYALHDSEVVSCKEKEFFFSHVSVGNVYGP